MLYYNILTREVTFLETESILPIAITVDDEGDIYISEAWRLFIYRRNEKELRLILDKNIFKESRYGRICHIGALAVISGKSIVFSDTIKNCVYEARIDKDNKTIA